MTSTLSVPFQILAEVHEIEGGGYWAEVRAFPVASPRLNR